MLRVLAISFLVLFLASTGLDHAFHFKSDKEPIEWPQAEKDQHEEEKEEDSIELLKPTRDIHKTSSLLQQMKITRVFPSSKEPFCAIFLPLQDVLKFLS